MPPRPKRDDRRTSSDDNEVKYPRPRVKEPLSLHEAIQQRDNARADKFLLKKENDRLQQENQNTSVHLI